MLTRLSRFSWLPVAALLSALTALVVASAPPITRAAPPAAPHITGNWSLTGNSGIDPATNFLGTKDAKPVILHTNNLERLRIQPSGNVGIGTASPANKLSVNGNANFTGKVGIGTTAPTNKLDVWPSSTMHVAAATSGLWVSNEVDSTLGITPVGSGQVRIKTDVAGRWISFADGAGTSDTMTIRNGKVGIGVSNPIARLGVMNSGVAIWGTGSTGVYGDSQSGSGVYGISGNGTGVYGRSDSGTGVYGYSNSGYAGYFSGAVNIAGSVDMDGPVDIFDDVWIWGDLTVTGSCCAVMDYPLDPANKYLKVSTVNATEQYNVFSGNITTDAKGEATVTLPDYFEAANRDPRYQLTVIGQFAQAIIARKIKNNRFVIKTDKPSVEVS